MRKNMRIKRSYYPICAGALILAMAVLSGCGKKDQAAEPTVEMRLEETETEETETEETKTEEAETSIEAAEPTVMEMDWSGYFQGIPGTAVFYDADNLEYQIYDPELADTRRSPCSTFKIISSLAGLEHGVIKTENSVRTWSGEHFWNEDWNRDIDFPEAFRTSCVWYFREVINEIGADLMQQELERLSYGNCDISDWEGRLNTNNSNRALTGFWIESSLLISPKEQTEVMERIFGEESVYSEATRAQLRQAMLVSEEDGISIYGKTGMGKARGVVVDAWFAGFAESGGKRVSFCVYLGEAEDKDVSSTRAKEIAVELVREIFSGEGCGETT